MFGKINKYFKSLLSTDPVFSGASLFDFGRFFRNTSKRNFLEMYELVLYVNRALNKRAEKVGEIEFYVEKNGKVVDKHPLIELLNKPNKSFSKSEFFELWQKYYDIYGQVYIWKEGEKILRGERIEALHLLDPSRCKPSFNEKTGEIKKVRYATDKGEKSYEGEEIIYHHRPSPRNPLCGESLLNSGVRQVETSMQIDEYHSRVIANGGFVDGVFNFEGDLTKEQLEMMKEKYQEQYGSAAKSGLPLFLSGKAKYQRMGMTPAEMGYLDTKKVTLDDVVMLTGVPKAIMGIPTDETYSNADAAIRVFLKEVVKPLMCGLADKLGVLVDEGEKLMYIDPTPENREEKRKDIENGMQNHYLTINEARSEMGYETIPNGDVILTPLNLIPLGREKAEKKIKGVNRKSPACRREGESKSDCVERKIPELIDEGYGQEQAVAIANTLCSRTCKVKEHPLRDIDIRRKYHALCLKRLDRRQKKTLDVVRRYMQEQEERLVDKLKAQKTYRKKDLLGEIFNEQLEIRLAQETLLPVLSELLREAAEDAKDITGSEWEYNETTEVRSWIDKTLSETASVINSTTYKGLKKIFQESFSQGEDRPKLIRRIQEKYQEISKGRAEVIARTETHKVTQFGTLQGYKQGGMPIKIWVWAPGTKGGVRDEHQAMDGEEKSIESSFSNGLMFPGDPSGPAKEIVNCQCFL